MNETKKIDKYICFKCKNIYTNLKDVILFYELKNVYNEIYSTAYICVHCNKKEMIESDLKRLYTINDHHNLWTKKGIPWEWEET